MLRTPALVTAALVLAACFAHVHEAPRSAPAGTTTLTNAPLETPAHDASVDG